MRLPLVLTALHHETFVIDRVKKDKKKLKLEGSDEVVASAYGETKRKKKRSSQEDATEMMPAAVNGKDRAPKNNEEKKRAKKEEKGTHISG